MTLKSEQSEDTEDCTIQFVNSTSETIQTFWVDFDGLEKHYTDLEPGHKAAQHTFSTHPWRVRFALSKALVGDYVGPSAVFEAKGEGKFETRPLPTVLAQPNPEWGTWRQRADALGIRIMAYDCVGDAAVQVACHLVRSMLQHTPHDIVTRLVEHNARVGIIGCSQVTTDMPDHWYLKLSSGGRDLDTTTRGLGGSESCAFTSCGEENLTMENDDHYPTENILIHEFGHTVMNVGLTSKEREDIEELYQKARESGVYKLDIYAMENADEYWAEGTQAWFDATIRTDVNSGVNTRDKLKRLDPGLSRMMLRAYGDGQWRYTHDCPRPFRAKRRRTGSGGGEISGSQGGDAGAMARTGSTVDVAPGSLEMDRDRLAATSSKRAAVGLAGLCASGCVPGVGAGLGQGLGPAASVVQLFASCMPGLPATSPSAVQPGGPPELEVGLVGGAQSWMVGAASVMQLPAVYSLARSLFGGQHTAAASTKSA